MFSMNTVREWCKPKSGIHTDTKVHRARIKDLEGQGHFQKGHFRLRRALWLSKKAPRPSKKRHKGQKRKKGSKFKGGGGSDFKKKNPPQKAKKKSSQTAQLSSLRSTQCKTHCNANGMRCDLHRHEITSINDKKYIKKLTHVSKCAMFCSFCNDCSKISDFYRFLAMDSSAEITKISPRYNCDS